MFSNLRADFLSPKAIGNRIKSKGLQKLRFYCQMCGKQCRDENGFKCHLTSESHKRQMEIFGQNPHRIIEGFSEEFERDFLDHLKRCHPFSRISANVVYNEFIGDKTHIHMNATKWLTLTEFVKYLGREGKCRVDDTPKGWFISLIHRDPKEDADEKNLTKRKRDELEEEERHQRALKLQIERAKKAAKLQEEEEGDGADNGKDNRTAPSKDDLNEFRPEDMDGPLKISLGGAASAHPSPLEVNNKKAIKAGSTAFEDDNEDDGGNLASFAINKKGGAYAKKSKLEELMERDLRAKQHDTRGPRTTHDRGTNPNLSALGTTRNIDKNIDSINMDVKQKDGPWLHKNIVVKVMSKALKAHGYYKEKGVVIDIVDSYIAEIQMIKSGDVVRVDQAELETVIPHAGGNVLVVQGKYKGCRGTLVSIDEEHFNARVDVVVDATLGKKSVCTLEYEDFSKLP